MNKSNLAQRLKQAKTLIEECLTDLGDSATPQQARGKSAVNLRDSKPPHIDFNKPLRPFIKQYAKGMSGPKKFVLLISRLVGGDLKKEVALKEIEKQWQKMTSKSLLAMDFNRFFAGQAKDNDWVDSKKKGFYFLRPSWKDIFKSSNG